MRGADAPMREAPDATAWEPLRQILQQWATGLCKWVSCYGVHLESSFGLNQRPLLDDFKPRGIQHVAVVMFSQLLTYHL